MEITDEMVPWVVALVYGAFVFPIVPLALAWRAFAAQRPGRLARITLGILSVSYIWVLAVIVGAPVIGAHYTSLRANVIYLNAAAVLVGLILAFAGKGMRLQLVVGACAILMLWSYLAFVGSIA